jgi:FixJ family two-component response regulator
MIDDCMNRTKVKRGSDLPHSKLKEDDIRLIHALVAEREQMKATLKGLTNKAIADKWDVHVRTIDRITSGETWGHVA